MHKSALLSILMHGTAIGLIVVGLPQILDDRGGQKPPIVTEVVPDPQAIVLTPPAPPDPPGKSAALAPAPSPQDDTVALAKPAEKADAVDAPNLSMQVADAAPAPVNEVRINQATDTADPNAAQRDAKPEALEEVKQAAAIKPVDAPKNPPKKIDPPKTVEVKKMEPPKPASARKSDDQPPPAKRAPDQVAYNNAPANKRLFEHQWQDKDLSMLEGCWVLGRNSEATLAEGGKVMRGITRAGRLCFDQAGVGTRELVQEFPDDPRLVCRAPIRAVFTHDGRLLTTQPAVKCEPQSSKVTWNGPPNALDCVRQSDTLAICSDAQGNQHEFRRSGL